MQTNSPKAIFQQANLIYLGLLSGQVLFALVVLGLLYAGQLDIGMEAGIFTYLVPGLVVSAVFGAYVLQNRRNAAAAFLTNLEEKVSHYRQTIITCGAILEGANLVAIIIAMLTGELYYLLYFAIGLATFFLMRPSLDTFKKIYRISTQEAAELS